MSLETFLVIKNAVDIFLTKNEPQTVFVNGENDLLILPVIVFSPFKTLIFHGHWQYGVVAVEVGEASKEKAVRVLKYFQ